VEDNRLKSGDVGRVCFLKFLLICCSPLNLSRIQKIPRLLVGAADGYLYMYNLDPQEGGECTLMKQHK